jgi:hypothetical protein
MQRKRRRSRAPLRRVVWALLRSSAWLLKLRSRQGWVLALGQGVLLKIELLLASWPSIVKLDAKWMDGCMDLYDVTTFFVSAQDKKWKDSILIKYCAKEGLNWMEENWLVEHFARKLKEVGRKWKSNVNLLPCGLLVPRVRAESFMLMESINFNKSYFIH